MWPSSAALPLPQATIYAVDICRNPVIFTSELVSATRCLTESVLDAGVDIANRWGGH
ncbi:hypothetical protein E3G52_000995 [Mycobacteroides abscessus]|nr:hypothetical protein [Mycobacteroides abscessus]